MLVFEATDEVNALIICDIFHLLYRKGLTDNEDREVEYISQTVDAVSGHPDWLPPPEPRHNTAQ